jgi:hypothetical protein
MPGCIQDDLSVCGLRVMLRYAERNATQDVNRFASDVKQVSLFIFDAETDLFLSEQSATVDQMIDNCMLSLNVFPGDYHFVAWGNVAEDYEFEPFIKGQTTLDEAIITLKAQNNMVDEYPDDLYFGSKTYTVLPDLQANQQIVIDLVNNTKRIHVIATGLYDENSILEEDPQNPTFRAEISSRNGRYTFDNNPDPTGGQYTYIPRERFEVITEGGDEEGALLSDFVVLRETSIKEATNSSLRIYHRGNTRAGGEGEEEFYSVSLTDLLLIVASLEETTIENKDEFTLNIFINKTNGSVTIRVNEWTPVPVPGGEFGNGILGY